MVPAGSVAVPERASCLTCGNLSLVVGVFFFPPSNFFWQSFKTGSSTGGSTSPSRRAERTLKFTTEKVIGNGSFGVVYEARIIETGETVAIKKVLQDRRFKVGAGLAPSRWPSCCGLAAKRALLDTQPWAAWQPCRGRSCPCFAHGGPVHVARLCFVRDLPLLQRSNFLTLRCLFPHVPHHRTGSCRS